LKSISEFGQTASLLANLGVVVGIVFLIIEIRQNDQMLIEEQRLRQATAFKEIVEMTNEIRRFMASDPQLTEIVYRAQREESPTFTNTEFSQLFDTIGLWPNVIHSAYRYWEAGHISDQAWESLEQGVESYKNRDDLFSQIYMRIMATMPQDMKDHFEIPPANELPQIERSKYVR